MTALAVTNRITDSALIERVVVQGDLAKLTPDERLSYYFKVCESAGLNPLTKPFEYITLNNKLTLYALRSCTDQLRRIHKVSVDELTESERDGVFVVTAKVHNAEGRTDMAKGAVNIANLKGEVLANAIMKAETKAKRRATLSICGLGLLDETEIETIPHEIKSESREVSTPRRAPNPSNAKPPEHRKPCTFPAKGNRKAWAQNFSQAIAGVKNAAELHQWRQLNEEALEDIKAHEANLYSVIATEYKALAAKFAPSPDNGTAFDLDTPSTWAANPDALLKAVEAACKSFSDKPDQTGLEEWFYDNIETHLVDVGLFPPDANALKDIYERHLKRCRS